MTNTIAQAYPAQDRRVTREDAVTCLVSLLPILAQRHPPLWRDVLRAHRSDRIRQTEPETMLLYSLFKAPCPAGLVGRVPDSDLRWNIGVRCCWDAWDEVEVKQLVIGVWRVRTLGSVRTWQGNNALVLVDLALQVLAEEGS